MYPKNATTPPEILIGQVIQISDGAVQTTGASARVKIGTAAWGAAAGTLTCDTTSGHWYYAPTQAETNAESFQIAIYKASCTGSGITVVTTDTATAGRVAVSGTKTTLDDLNDIAATAVVSGGAITTSSGAVSNVTTVASVSGSVGSVSGSVGSVTGNVSGSVGSISGVTFPSNFGDLAITVTSGQVTVGTNNDKTGYSISGTKTTLDDLNDIAATAIVSGGAITTSSGAVSTVTSVTGSVGSISGVTFPTNFADLAITLTTGYVTVGTNNDKTNYTISGTITTLDSLDAGLQSQHSSTQGQISALNDISTTDVKTQADQALVDIHLDHAFAVDYDPASKPGISTALFNELIENDAGVSRFTANALEQGPSGGGSFWSSTEQEQIRYRLGIDGTESAPATNTDQNLTVDLNADQSGVTIGTVTTLTGHTAQTGDSFARLGAPTGASVSADVAAVKSDTGATLTDTNEIQGDLTNGGRLDLIFDELTTQGDTNEAKIDTVDSNVDTLLTRVTSTLFSGITSLAEWLGLLAGKQAGNATALTELQATGAGSGTFDEATDSLEAIVDAGAAGLTTQQVRDAMKLAPSAGAAATDSIDDKIDSIDVGGGTGSNSVTPVVDDGTDPIENATITYRLAGVLKATGNTNASGNPASAFGLDDATYDVIVTADGYTSLVTTHEVPGGGLTPTFSMTLIAISTPADPAKCNCYAITVDEASDPESGVIVKAVMTKAPSGTGVIFDDEETSDTSDGDGLVELFLARGATYDIYRGGNKISFLVPNAATAEITKFIG